MHIISKQGSTDNVLTYEHICDTSADMAKIDRKYITLGSVCIILAGESGAMEVYMADSNKEWHDILAGASSGGSTPSGLTLHICAQNEVSNGKPNIEFPLETVLYLVPSGAETGNLYDEYIWVNNAWELFGGARVNLTGYATQEWVSQQGYLTNHQDISALALKSEIPTYVSTLQNDSGYLTSFTETDPTVPAWAKASQKPAYTAQEVGALPANTQIPIVPTNISAFTNDANYLSNPEATTMVENWLESNITSGNVIDASLTIEGAGADAKKTGDEISNLKSALNDKVDSTDIYGGSKELEPISVLEGRTIDYTNIGSAVNPRSVSNDREVLQYDVSSMVGTVLTVLNNNNGNSRNYYTDGNGIAISELVAGTTERTSTVPQNAVYLYLTHNIGQIEAKIEYPVDDYLVKTFNTKIDEIENEVSAKVDTNEIFEHYDTITPVEIIDGKYVGHTSSGAPNLLNNASHQVLVYDVSELAGKKLSLCTYNNSSMNYWCDANHNAISQVTSGTGERTIYVLFVAKYLYISNYKPSGNAYLKKHVTDTIAVNVDQSAFRLENMLLNPLLVDASEWAGDTNVVDGMFVLSGTKYGHQIRQVTSNKLIFNAGDKIYCRAVVPEISNIGYSYFSISGASDVSSAAYSYQYIRSGHDVLENKIPYVVSRILTAPEPRNDLTANKFFFHTIASNSSEISLIKIYGLACINLTKAFGAGNEPNRSTIDLVLDAMPAKTFDGEINITNARYLLSGAEYMPKNGGTFIVNPLGNCELRSVPNPDWSGWSDYWNTYGRTPSVSPVPNKVHGDLETDAMFTVIPKYGRWTGYANGNHPWGGHVFEAWTIDHFCRLTLIIGKNYQDEANMIVYHVKDPNDSDSPSNYFGRIRIGCDVPQAGFVINRNLMEAYGDIAFYSSYGPVLKSPNGTRYKIRVADDGTLYTERSNITLRDEEA